jgi:hypothetical protein
VCLLSHTLSAARSWFHLGALFAQDFTRLKSKPQLNSFPFGSLVREGSGSNFPRVLVRSISFHIASYRQMTEKLWYFLLILTSLGRGQYLLCFHLIKSDPPKLISIYNKPSEMVLSLHLMNPISFVILGNQITGVMVSTVSGPTHIQGWG